MLHISKLFSPIHLFFLNFYKAKLIEMILIYNINLTFNML